MITAESLASIPKDDLPEVSETLGDRKTKRQIEAQMGSD